MSGWVAVLAGCAACFGIKLLVGTELTLADGTRLVLLACNRAGYGNLCAIISLARRRSAKGSYRLASGDLARGVPDCLAIWLADSNSPSPAGHWLAKAFAGRCWIAWTRSSVTAITART